MSDDNDIAIATAAAETVIQADILKYVPAIFQSRIPPDTAHKLASEVAQAVVAALAKAHTGT